MEKEKMTIKGALERAIEIVKAAGVEDEAVIVEKLEKEVEKASKKRTGLTKVQKENLELVERVYDVIAAAEKDVTIADVYAQVQDIEGITSTNKVSALITKLVNAGRVERVDNGKSNKTYKVIEIAE